MDTQDLMANAVLAYWSENPNAEKIEVSIACCAPLRLVHRIIAKNNLVIRAPGFGFVWSEPELITNARGVWDLRVARPQPNDRFWRAWEKDKQALKDAGYSPRKINGVWYVYHYAPAEVDY